MTINVNVAVEDLDLTTQIGTRHIWNGDDDGINEPITLADAVVTQLVAKAIDSAEYKSLRDRVSALRTEEIRNALTPIIAEAIAEGVQRTDTWGNPIGAPQSLREFVIEETHTVLNGMTETRYGRTTFEALGRRLIREEVESVLSKELSEVIKAEREKVIAAVHASAADLIADAVRKGLNR